MKSQKISIGVIGVGHLGQHHAKHYSNMNHIHLLGVHDTDSVRGKKIANTYNTKYFTPPLPSREVLTLLKQVQDTKNYLYNSFLIFSLWSLS